MDISDQDLEIDFEPHSEKQGIAALSDYKITLTCTGTQWGKTTVGAVWMKRHNYTFTSRKDNFLITAPSYKILRQATLPAFLSRMEGCGEYKAGDQEFKILGGGTVYLRTATHPDSIVGITDIRAIWGDEAGKYSLYFWENMQARAAFKDAPILLTTSPYATNWVYKDLIEPVRKGLRDDVLLITASSNENPYYSKKEFEQKRKTMDPRRFAALFLGEFSTMQGLVYPVEWADHTVFEFELPHQTKYFGGIDWGFSNPFALLVRAVTPSGYHYTVSETYLTGLTISDMKRIAKEKRSIFGIERFVADPSRPDAIEEFNRAGIPTIGANNDIRLGVDTHLELILSGKYKIFHGRAPHLLDEYSTYHYPEPEELKPDQASKEQLPVAQDNHAVDADRYLTMMLRSRTGQKNTPRVLDEKPSLDQMTQERRIAFLKKKRRDFETY